MAFDILSALSGPADFNLDILHEVASSGNPKHLLNTALASPAYRIVYEKNWRSLLATLANTILPNQPQLVTGCLQALCSSQNLSFEPEAPPPYHWKVNHPSNDVWSQDFTGCTIDALAGLTALHTDIQTHLAATFPDYIRHPLNLLFSHDRPTPAQPAAFNAAMDAVMAFSQQSGVPIDVLALGWREMGRNLWMQEMLRLRSLNLELTWEAEEEEGEEMEVEFMEMRGKGVEVKYELVEAKVEWEDFKVEVEGEDVKVKVKEEDVKIKVEEEDGPKIKVEEVDCKVKVEEGDVKVKVEEGDDVKMKEEEDEVKIKVESEDDF